MISDCWRPALAPLAVSCRVVRDHWHHGSAATHALKRPNGHHHPATSLSPPPLLGGQNHFPLLPGNCAGCICAASNAVQLKHNIDTHWIAAQSSALRIPQIGSFSTDNDTPHCLLWMPVLWQDLEALKVPLRDRNITGTLPQVVSS